MTSNIPDDNADTSGLDADLYSAEQADWQTLPKIQAEIAAVRTHADPN